LAKGRERGRACPDSNRVFFQTSIDTCAFHVISKKKKRGDEERRAGKKRGKKKEKRKKGRRAEWSSCDLILLALPTGGKSMQREGKERRKGS